MKRKMSVVLLMMAVLMTACGTKETTVDTDDVNKTTEEVTANNPVSTPEVTDPVSTPEPEVPEVPAVVSDKIDKIVDVDIPVGSQSEKVGFPELHLYVTGDLVEQVSSGTTRYSIPNDTIHLKVSARYYQDTISCWATYQVPHYETADYGRYIVDVDYQENISYGATYITVFDSQLNCGIEIDVEPGPVNETAPTDEQRTYIKNYALAEAEYIKEQVSKWPQDFVPGDSSAAPVEAPTEVVETSKVYALDVYPDITVTLNYSADGTVEVLCQSPHDSTVQQRLVETSDGKLQAINENGEMFMEITVGDGKIFLDTPFMEYANFYGDYTLKE